MASNLPDALRLREVKYGLKATPALQTRTAKSLIEAGRVAEALDLFLLAGDEEGVDGVRRRAVAEGRPVLLLMLVRAGRHPTAAEWRAAAERAAADERWREAYRCYMEAGDEEGMAKVQERLPGYDLYVPQGK